MVAIKKSEATAPLDNTAVAARLEELAELLDASGANPFRARAYRTAAETLRRLDEPVHELLGARGRDALTELPGIGDSIARSVERLVTTGKLSLLSRLRGRSEGEAAFATVPGVGPKTAARIRQELHIDTLGELEASAYDGRLAALPGMGRKRLQAIRESLAGRFRRSAPATVRPTVPPADEPPVAELLSIDEEFRAKAAAGRLLRISPLRFNPTGEAWLPILHTRRDDRSYTALYSNTARAHELGTTHDWVVIYRDEPGARGQWTVITSQLGRLQGRRIVRGRETECAQHYAGGQTPDP